MTPSIFYFCLSLGGFVIAMIGGSQVGRGLGEPSYIRGFIGTMAMFNGGIMIGLGIGLALGRL